MQTYLSTTFSVPLGATKQDVTKRLCKHVNLPANKVTSVQLYKQSVDARKKNDVHFACAYTFCASQTPRNASAYVQPTDYLLEASKVANAPSVIVVGAGPAGLFCALYLAKCGCKVTIVERGGDIVSRQTKVANFFGGGNLDEQCNVQFGLGGAGTFSDGKLTSGISSPLTHSVFQQFVRNGAPKDILTTNLPHIGTDNLVNVVANLRDEITSLGAIFLFDTQVVDFVTQDNAVVGVVAQNNQGKKQLLADKVVLACGHSARDLFALLNDMGVNLQFKPFAVGVRVEHSAKFINQAQYGALFATHKDLPTASYKLVYNHSKNRSCYSFCMCPGGVVVPATSNDGAVVVNGMSNYARDGKYSNSALVVNVTQQDVDSYGFGNDCLAGVRFQHHLEQSAYLLGGGNYVAPCQNVTDFVANKPTTTLQFTPSYARFCKATNLCSLFPQEITYTLQQALAYFDNVIKGFGSSGVLTAVESRTSSPVKIVRDDTFQSNLQNLYPVGEGAGYAGGIVSSAVDGLRVAIKIVGG